MPATRIALELIRAAHLHPDAETRAWELAERFALLRSEQAIGAGDAIAAIQRVSR
jgi:hypothetical protein